MNDFCFFGGGWGKGVLVFFVASCKGLFSLLFTQFPRQAAQVRNRKVSQDAKVRRTPTNRSSQGDASITAILRDPAPRV